MSTLVPDAVPEVAPVNVNAVEFDETLQLQPVTGKVRLNTPLCAVGPR